MSNHKNRMTKHNGIFSVFKTIRGDETVNFTGICCYCEQQKRRSPFAKTPRRKMGLPGGLMNLGESFEEVAIREVLEETGITVKNIKMLHVFSGKEYFTKTPNGDEFYSVTAVFLAKQYDGQLTVDDVETVDVRFFQCHNLPTKMVGSHRQFIRQFQNEIQSM